MINLCIHSSLVQSLPFEIKFGVLTSLMIIHLMYPYLEFYINYKIMIFLGVFLGGGKFIRFIISASYMLGLLYT